MKKKVFKIELMVIDHHQIGEAQIAQALEHTRYPNDCIWPKVIWMKGKEVDWTDEHPLNFEGKQVQAFVDLFEERGLWVQALSDLIGKRVMVERKGHTMSIVPRTYTLMGVDEECLLLKGIWPIDHTGRPGPNAKEYRIVVDRKEIASVAEVAE